ncbi:MAG: replication-associated recombination protein A [Bacteroidales bacterium]|nr:replication-associated recombination protein A [Bacteroidales bacterium]
METIPLAEILRPGSLNDYIGQEHLVGEGAVLYNTIVNNSIPSMIFWGPPGVGKTTLAYIISQTLNRKFYTLSAINSGVKDVRAVIEAAKESSEPSVMFIDEIHRFSKSQQDSLLGAVEKGTVTLIGATTENPSFEVITPLLSRCQVYILKTLEKEDLLKIIAKAIEYYRTIGIEIDISEDEALIRISGGDARKLYNAIELLVSSLKKDNNVHINNELTLKIIQQNLAMYDKKGEQHYDIISAFIKSMRGSDPNAAVYWLARMIEGGEDPLFIARRMLILASEDIGNANPNALLLANACFDAVNKIGWPESRIILSQTTVYLATSPKSNSTYTAIDEAIAFIGKTGDLPVPLSIRNAPTRLMKDIGYGKDYKYAHSYESNFIDHEFLPDKIRGTKFFEPGSNARENEIRAFLKARWKQKYNY